MAPKDKYNLVYCQLFFLGLASLLPWNFLITADSFWAKKFSVLPDIDPTRRTFMNSSIANVSGNFSEKSPVHQFTAESVTISTLRRSFFTLFAQLPSALFAFYTTVVTNGVKESRRMYGSLAAMTLAFVIITIFVEINTDPFQTVYFGITITCVFVLNACAALVRACIFGPAAALPPGFLQAVFTGQGTAGMFASMAFIVAISVTDDPSDYALIFFTLAALVLVLAMVCYWFMKKNEFFRHYKEHSVSDRSSTSMLPPQPNTQTHEVHEMHDLIVSVTENGATHQKDQTITSVVICEKGKTGSYFRVFKKIYFYLFCCCFTFFVSISIHPSLTASVRPMSSGTIWSDKYFSPVACFLLFTCGDFSGRLLANVVTWPRKDDRKSMLALVLGRTVFFFLFAFCNAKPRRYSLPVFTNDAYYIVFMTIFSVSHGHLNMLAIKYAPQMLESQLDRQLCGKMTTFSISFGLAIGAVFSFIPVSLI